MRKSLVKAKSSYRHGNLREAILTTSLQIVEQSGVEGLSIREAAKKAGVTHQAPYRHFKDREALLAALAGQGFADLLSEMKTSLEGSREPFERLRIAAQAYTRWAVAHSDHFRLMFSSAIPEYDTTPELKAVTDQILELVLGLVRQCQDKSVIRKEDPRGIARQFWAAVQGVSLLFVDKQFKPLRGDASAGERLAREIVTNLVNGMRPEN